MNDYLIYSLNIDKKNYSDCCFRERYNTLKLIGLKQVLC